MYLAKLVRLNVKGNFKKRAEELHTAAGKGSLATVKKLAVQIGVNASNKFGETALMESAFRGKVNVLKWLLRDELIEVNWQDDRFKNSALIWAANSGQLEAMKALVQQSSKTVKLNLQNNTGHTALFEAALGNHLDIVEFLAEQGADIHITNHSGQTVLEAVGARRRKDTEAAIQRGLSTLHANCRAQREAFLMGMHERLGRKSAVLSFACEDLFDVNMLTIIFEFAHPLENVAMALVTQPKKRLRDEAAPTSAPSSSSASASASAPASAAPAPAPAPASSSEERKTPRASKKGSAAKKPRKGSATKKEKEDEKKETAKETQGKKKGRAAGIAVVGKKRMASKRAKAKDRDGDGDGDEDAEMELDDGEIVIIDADSDLDE